MHKKLTAHFEAAYKNQILSALKNEQQTDDNADKLVFKEDGEIVSVTGKVAGIMAFIGLLACNGEFALLCVEPARFKVKLTYPDGKEEVVEVWRSGDMFPLIIEDLMDGRSLLHDVNTRNTYIRPNKGGYVPENENILLASSELLAD